MKTKKIKKKSPNNNHWNPDSSSCHHQPHPQKVFWRLWELANVGGWARIAGPVDLLRKEENQQTKDAFGHRQNTTTGTFRTLRSSRGSQPHSNSARKYNPTLAQTHTHTHFWYIANRHLVAWHRQQRSGNILWVMEHSQSKKNVGNKKLKDVLLLTGSCW